MDSQNVSLPVKRRLACEQLSYYGQVENIYSICVGVLVIIVWFVLHLLGFFRFDLCCFDSFIFMSGSIFFQDCNTKRSLLVF